MQEDDIALSGIDIQYQTLPVESVSQPNFESIIQKLLCSFFTSRDIRVSLRNQVNSTYLQ